MQNEIELFDMNTNIRILMFPTTAKVELPSVDCDEVRIPAQLTNTYFNWVLVYQDGVYVQGNLRIKIQKSKALKKNYRVLSKNINYQKVKL